RCGDPLPLPPRRLPLRSRLLPVARIRGDRRRTPIWPGEDTLVGRAALRGATVQIADAWTDPAYGPKSEAMVGKVRSMLGVPLTRDSLPIGMFGLARATLDPFSERDVALVEGFADQAVIAMENARLVGDLQQRTRDIEEALEYQTATSDVLKFIGRSAGDLDAVFDFICDTAARLCQASAGSVFRLDDGGVYRCVTGFGLEPEYRAIEESSVISPGVGTLVGRAALTGQVVHLVDGMADPDYEAKDELRVSKCHTIMGVPLLRESTAIGVICLSRRA